MPLCLEHKHLLSGGVHTYPCELIHYDPGFGILKYVIDREYFIHGHTLSPGDITVAFFWEDRPYTLYVWRLKNGTVLHYFNIADRITLSPAEFVWRDLVIDILIVNRNDPHILDSNELPACLDVVTKEYIHASREHILLNYHAILAETDSLMQ